MTHAAEEFAVYNPVDKDCICYVNWRNIIKEYEKFLDKKFVKENGEEFYLVGFVHASDDYYYLLWNCKEKRHEQWSCVGSLENFGLELSDG